MTYIQDLIADDSEIIEVYGYHGTSMNSAIKIIESGFKPSNVEGENIYPSSAIYDLAHVQIVVRNTAFTTM